MSICCRTSMSAPDLDFSVDVAALFRDPATTLLPVLSCLPGWDQVHITSTSAAETAKQPGLTTRTLYGAGQRGRCDCQADIRGNDKHHIPL